MMRKSYLRPSALILAVLPVGNFLHGADFKPDETVVYKTVGETSLQLNVFNPKGHQTSEKRPAIVFFHGGGWRSGNPDQFFPHCRHLAEKGMVAISAQYRLTSQEGVKITDCATDGKSAIRWVRQHADKLGIDPERIAAGGGSAGGQIAAVAGNSKGFEAEAEDLSISSKPDALVLFNPVANNGPGGFGHKGLKPVWEQISPMHNINENSPPTLLLNGTVDKLVPVSEIREYERRMTEAGRRCVVVLYEGKGHSFFNYKSKNNQLYNETVAEMDAFLASLGFL